MHEVSAKVVHKKELISSSNVVFLSPGETGKLLPYTHLILGTNSRDIGDRAKILLGWNPSTPSFEDEIWNTLDSRRDGWVCRVVTHIQSTSGT